MGRECRRCELTPADQPHSCAFIDGKPFDPSAYNCGSLRPLREAAHTVMWRDSWDETPAPGNPVDPITVAQSDSMQSIACFPLEHGEFLILGYYKNRGRTELALRVDSQVFRPITVADCEEAIRHHGLAAGTRG